MIYRNKKSKIRLFLVLLLCNLFFYSGCKKKSYIENKAENLDIRKNYYKDYKKEKKNDKNSAYSKLYVDISGAVKNPGVYSLDKGKRVFDAIEKAGGLLENAYIKDLNRAKELEDGEKIYIYTKEEYDNINDEKVLSNTKPSTSSDSTNTTLLNINKASKEELMTLSGIGESKADSIISYRNKKGSFKKKEDLMNITGIKDGVYNKIKDMIRVN